MSRHITGIVMKSGNSMYVRIPKRMAKILDIEVGCVVKIELQREHETYTGVERTA